MRRELDGILNNKEADALLLFFDSYKDANMYYLTNFLSPDPFLFLKKVDSDSTIIVSQMEYLRAEKESRIKDVRSYSDYNYEEIMKTKKDPVLGALKFISKIVENELDKKLRISVPPNFPAILADILRKKGLKIIPMLGVIEKARETKEIQEIKQVEKVQKISEESMTKVIRIISNSDVANNKTLQIKGKPLTVGTIKSFFGHIFLDNGCLTEEDIIVACGPKTSDPHYLGKSEDELKANQPIILDIYPRSIANRYWSDMTRTIVKGKASDKIKHMFKTVYDAKSASLDAFQAGIVGSNVFDICSEVLEKAGYGTSKGNRKITKGMTHSLGHGVGLEIHENPRINEFSNSILEANSIVTVEPGIYEPGVGGVRLEDIIKITKTGYRNLTKMEEILEI